MFRMHLLPAYEGDCIILEYGDESNPRRVLVDGGHTETSKAISEFFGETPVENRTFELVVVTHIDNDHIEGILSLLTSIPMENVGDIWFNAPQHFGEEPPEESFGQKALPEGNRLVDLLEARRPWNDAFDGKAVATWCRPVTLADGLTLRVVSPDVKGLRDMVDHWEQATEEENLDPYRPQARAESIEEFTPPETTKAIREAAEADFSSDSSETNHSSIALLAEYDGKSVLLAGDAYAGCLKRSLAALCPEGVSALPIDVVKLPHHGSERNVSKGLLETIACGRFAVSTNSINHGHPDVAAIARVVTQPGMQELLFNYRTPQTECWENPDWQDDLEYSTTYAPSDSQGWLTIEV